jgi:hypothetical protein
LVGWIRIWKAVLRNRNDLLRFRFRLRKSFGSNSSSGSGSRQYLAQFSENNKNAQDLAFSMSEAAYFQGSWPFIFDYSTFLLHFMLHPDPNRVPVPEP